jgi:hypothetical protein
VRAIALGSSIFLGGDFFAIGQPYQFQEYLASVDYSSGSLMSWNGDIAGSVSALAVSGGMVYVAGDFGQVSNLPRRGLAALSTPVVGVDSGSESTSRSRLSATPNPFRGELNVTFMIPQRQRIELAVYDLAGRLVKRLHDGALASGEQHFTWDGRNDEARTVGAGVYFLHVRGDQFDMSTKVLHLR